MKIKADYKEWCYSVFDDGFWYSLTCWATIEDPDELHLEDREDAEKVLNAINVLKEYEKACEERAEEYQDEPEEFDEDYVEGED